MTLNQFDIRLSTEGAGVVLVGSIDETVVSRLPKDGVGDEDVRAIKALLTEGPFEQRAGSGIGTEGEKILLFVFSSGFAHQEKLGTASPFRTDQTNWMAKAGYGEEAIRVNVLKGDSGLERKIKGVHCATPMHL
jgi:hypothetical protein